MFSAPDVSLGFQPSGSGGRGVGVTTAAMGLHNPSLYTPGGGSHPGHLSSLAMTSLPRPTPLHPRMDTFSLASLWSGIPAGYTALHPGLRMMTSPPCMTSHELALACKTSVSGLTDDDHVSSVTQRTGHPAVVAQPQSHRNPPLTSSLPEGLPPSSDYSWYYNLYHPYNPYHPDLLRQVFKTL